MASRKKFFSILNSWEFKSQFTPEHKEQLLEQYRNSIGLGKDVTFNSDAMDKYTQSMKKNYKDFSKKNDKGKETPSEFKQKMDAPPPSEGKNQLATVVERALEPSDLFTQAKDNYAASIEAFKELVKQVPEKYNAISIRQELKSHQDLANKAIRMQHKKELTDLKDNLKEEEMVTILGIDAEEAARIKAELVSDLEASHKAQLKEFETAASNTMEQIDKSSSLEMEQLIFTAQLYNFAKGQDFHLLPSTDDQLEMIAEINRVRENNLRERGITEENNETEAMVDIENNKIFAVNPDDLNFIISLTGNRLIHEKDEKTKKNMWSVEMSHRIFSPLYYLSNKERPKVDLLVMAAAMRASGISKVTLTIDFKDDDTRKTRARQAYEAYLETGYPPEKIKLQDGNKKEIKPEELFSPKELQEIKRNAQSIRDRAAEINKKERGDVMDLKADLAAFKQQKNAAALDVTQEKDLAEKIQSKLQT